MTGGDAKVETIVDANGTKRISRIPQKPLNKLIKAALLTLLKRDDISIKDDIRASGNTFTVLDQNGKYLFSYHDAWDYGYYTISMANPNEGAEPLLVAEMDWRENDLYTNPQQQDVFDVFEALKKRRDELRSIEKAREDLTPEEVQALQALGVAR